MNISRARIAFALLPCLAATASGSPMEDCWSVADAQARIVRLEADMSAREAYTGKEQSTAKVAYYREQIALERRFIEQANSPSGLNCAPAVAATQPAQAPCPAARHAR